MLVVWAGCQELSASGGDYVIRVATGGSPEQPRYATTFVSAVSRNHMNLLVIAALSLHCTPSGRPPPLPWKSSARRLQFIGAGPGPLACNRLTRTAALVG